MLTKKLLIANRGEIAIRVARTSRELGVASAAVYTDADRDSLHVRRRTKPGARRKPARLPRRRASRRRRRPCGVRRASPGLRLSFRERGFRRALRGAGLTFIGPPSDAIRVMGEKQRARATMAAAGVPVVPGGGAGTLDEARATAARVGYPMLVKAANGGGGKGMRLVKSEAELASRSNAPGARPERPSAAPPSTSKSPRRRAPRRGSSPRRSRGPMVHLVERDCSLQRRHQKIVEETPCPVLTPTRARRSSRSR